MSLYRRDDSRTWWISINSCGRRIRQSTGTENKKLAEKIYAKIVTEIEEGRYFDSLKAKRITFAEMVTKYKSKYQHARDEYTIKRLLPAFGHLMLAEITTELVSDYRDERLKSVRPATVYQELALMRRMFNVARREWKWTKENPVSDLSFSVGNKNARDRWLTLEEERLLLSKAANPSWLRPLLIVALHTGMRRGEILDLMWRDLDFNRRLITIQKSKNGEKRGIPMSQTVFLCLKNWGRVVDISGRVFPFAVRSLRAAFEKTLEKAGIENFHFHDLRHTFATRLVQKGVDLYKVKELLGHKTINMTMRYAHHYPESLRSSVEVLDSCHGLVTLRAESV